ncbi:winged helix-turn-helix domain-containing protein [Streptomyces sp. S6]
MGAQQIGEGGGREFQRVADELRARISGGAYPVGAFLPSQRELAEEFEVSRDTVQRVLRDLAGEGWVQTRQGSGTRVVKTMLIRSGDPARSRQVSLGPLLAEAFERSDVALDVYTLTSETLSAHFLLQAERIFSRQISPRSVRVRMLLPAGNRPLPYPSVVADGNDPRLWDRLDDITRQHITSLERMFAEMKVRKAVEDVELHIKRTSLFPASKLYLLNGSQALMGPYEVIERPIVLDTGDEVQALDVLGLGATLMHFVKDDDPNSVGTVFVDSWQSWFNSVWDLLAE